MNPEIDVSPLECKVCGQRLFIIYNAVENGGLLWFCSKCKFIYTDSQV
jgi:hypothetical protein